MTAARCMCMALLVAICFGGVRVHAQDGGFVSEEEIIRQLEKKGVGKAKKFKVRGLKIGPTAPAQTPAAQQISAGSASSVSPASPPPSVTVTINFMSDSTGLADDFSRRQLDAVGQALSSQQLAGSRVEVGGHTDSRGSDAYNLDLSYRRAEAIRHYLVSKYGVGRVEIRGYGESRPVASNDTPEGMARNRRVVITRLD